MVFKIFFRFTFPKTVFGRDSLTGQGSQKWICTLWLKKSFSKRLQNLHERWWSNVSTERGRAILKNDFKRRILTFYFYFHFFTSKRAQEPCTRFFERRKFQSPRIFARFLPRQYNSSELRDGNYVTGIRLFTVLATVSGTPHSPNCRTAVTALWT